MTGQQASTESNSDGVDWQLVAKCRMGKTRESILLNLYRSEIDDVRTATDFAQRLTMGDYPACNPSVEAVSAALRRLNDLGIMECKNPEAPHHRLYGLTEQGKQVVEKAFP